LEFLICIVTVTPYPGHPLQNALLDDSPQGIGQAAVHFFRIPGNPYYGK
jgi:hypothetical protein